MTINFTVPAGDGDKILEIAGKATPPGGDPFMTVLDLTVCHANGCPLDLDAMLEVLAEHGMTYDIAHDIAGIDQHINRDTGELEDFFIPRFAKRTEAG